MTSRDFCFWLQGYFEVSKADRLNPEKTKQVRNHLALVFKHDIDPSIGGDAAELQAIHDGKPTIGEPSKPGEELIYRC